MPADGTPSGAVASIAASRGSAAHLITSRSVAPPGSDAWQGSRRPDLSRSVGFGKVCFGWRSGRVRCSLITSALLRRSVLSARSRSGRGSMPAPAMQRLSLDNIPALTWNIRWLRSSRACTRQSPRFQHLARNPAVSGAGAAPRAAVPVPARARPSTPSLASRTDLGRSESGDRWSLRWFPAPTRYRRGAQEPGRGATCRRSDPRRLVTGHAAPSVGSIH
jgi:hypothetical protein